ncbi:hypothetical protein D6783_03545 [Candidatus Woesearchaeota archaeon]|nr:MAG: hypothetical protein D6783_03545 [Candidatus Woesearchaeota archaeon]
MKKETVLKALQALKKDSPQRNFDQSVDIIINLKNLNLKNPSDQVDFFVNLHHGIGRKITVCALVGPELLEDAKKYCDFAVEASHFDEYADKKKAKKLASTYDYFIAQANIMQRVAAVFGRTLGPRGKMPNPKAGCIIPPKGNVKATVEKLQKTVRIMAKKSPQIQLSIGKASQPEEEVVDNILYVYDQVIHHLPKEKENIKNVAIKLTMSKPVVLS